MPTAVKTEAKNLWINGRAVAAKSGKTFETINPADGTVIAQVAEGGKADIDAAVKAAVASADRWRSTSAKARGKILLAAARLIRERVDELGLLESRDSGKPIEAAKGEIGYAADVFEYYAGACTKHFGETIPVGNPGLMLTLREPVGVCGLIVPWNFPAVIAAWKLGPALACGNAVVLKPAAETPLSALVLGEIFSQAGLPDGVLNVVPGPGATGAALVEHPLVRKISFTGSTRTGTEIIRMASPDIKRVSLELGGKSANVVFDDVADLDHCVEKSIWSVFDNAGQDCCARSRFLLQEKIYDKFVDKLVARAKKIVVGDPMKKGTEMGPLISEKQRSKVAGCVSSGIKEGCEKLCGGGAPKAKELSKGFYLEPCVLAGAKPDMSVFREEIFGPVVCATPFKTEEEAIALANDSAYGLSGSVWTSNLGRGVRMAKALQTGALSINSSSSVYLEAPFGGYKASGLGRELGMKAMDLYTEVKSVFISEA